MAGRDVAQARAREQDEIAAAPQAQAGRRSAVGGDATGAIHAVRDRIVALRAEGQAGGAEGTALVARLLSRPSDVFATEAFLATGLIDRGADHAQWRGAIEALPADARAAYDAAIRTRGGEGLDATLAEDRERPADPTTARADHTDAREEATAAPEAAVAAAEETLAAPTPAPTGGGEYDDIAIEDFIAPAQRSASLSAIIIGNAEGTRRPAGGLLSAYGEHIDPGNEAVNRGSYSLQGATHLTPREADRVQQERMATRIPAYTAACQAAGVAPTNAIVLTTYFDLYNIKPALATAFAPLIAELASMGITHQNAIAMRLKASQNTQSRRKWSGWERIARDYLDKKSPQISDAEFWRVVKIVHTGRANRIRESMTALHIRHPGGAQTQTRPQTRPQTTTPTQTRPQPTRPQPSRPQPQQQQTEGADPRSYRLTGSVGDDGDNHPADVGAVQERLIEVGLDPGPVDRRSGPRTIAAIRKYQQAILREPDGLIEVGRLTEKNLFGLGGVMAIVDIDGGGGGLEADRRQGGRTGGSTPGAERPSVRRPDGMYMVGGYPSSVPAGTAQAMFTGGFVDVTLPNGIRIRPKVKMTAAIARSATALAPYLPRGTEVTSGARTDEHQARIIVDKAGGLIRGDLWQSYLHANGGRKAREVAWVGNSNHRGGLAFDLAGAPFSRIVEAIRRARIEHPEAGLHPGHVEKTCVHVKVDP